MAKNQEITVIAEVTALPGFENDVLELINAQTVASRKEDGILYFSPNEVVGEKGRFIFFEVFRNEEIFKHHMDSANSKAFFGGIVGKVVGDKVKATFLENVPISQ
ncbi:MAG: antibiotic biosynthesis monooxygenase [Bacteroidota bacterium]|nr:antibiotic biosynthesis monooxygenase [Bacteroidota bacterium]